MIITAACRSVPERDDRSQLLLDQLPADRITVINKIATDLGMEPVEVVAWAVDLLTRYVEAGGER